MSLDESRRRPQAKPGVRAGVDWPQEFFAELERLRPLVHGAAESWPRVFGYMPEGGRQHLKGVLLEAKVTIDVDSLTPQEQTWLLHDSMTDDIFLMSALRGRPRGEA